MALDSDQLVCVRDVAIQRQRDSMLYENLKHIGRINVSHGRDTTNTQRNSCNTSRRKLCLVKARMFCEKCVPPSSRRNSVMVSLIVVVGLLNGESHQKQEILIEAHGY